MTQTREEIEAVAAQLEKIVRGPSYSDTSYVPAHTVRDCYRAMRQLLDQTRWRPIEEAPKDGTRIIVYRPAAKQNPYIPQVGLDRWGKVCDEDCWTRSNSATPPTRWQPLPPPPEGE